jgi:hypothetical protein
MKITKKQAKKLGNFYNIDFDIVNFEEFYNGLNIELEHGSLFGKITNVTNNSLDKTAQITIAHLIEDPKYYFYLKKLEKDRDTYYKTHNKPCIFKNIS